jgi:serine/threonine protein kinase
MSSDAAMPEPTPSPPEVPAPPAPGTPPTATLSFNESGITHGVGNIPSLLGYQFDDFEILDQLGEGGMGIVYKARQISLDRVVAVKMLRAEHFRNPMVVQRFLAEARAVAALDHPNIVRIHQIGKCPAGQYFVMEYVDGQPLEKVLQKGPLAVAGSTLLVQRVAEAVHFAHQKSIIHRDLKPGNILINRFGQPVVVDFGIVKFMGQDSRLTQEGIVIGTPTYLPPEQTGENRHMGVGPHSDVYSLGAILYVMLAGRVPFPGDTAVEVLLKVMSPQPPDRLRQLRPEVPEELERICMKCLHKKPENRYETAQALADDLRRFRASWKPGAPARSSSPRTMPPMFLIDPETGQELRLAGATTLVGRAPECDVVLTSLAVSKRHCRIHRAKGQVILEDLKSSNGTWMNGHRVKRCRLADGARLEIGGHRFVVRIAHASP